MRRAFTICLFFAAIACSRTEGETQIVNGTAVDHGRAIFSDPAASPSASNAFSCATCHVTIDVAVDHSVPGGDLDGVARRATFWAGARVDLLASINDCRSLFMDAPSPWTVEDEEARAMYAYLTGLGGSGSATAFTIVRGAPDLPAGDPSIGAAVYQRACATCHGTAHDGAGRLVDFAPKLPDEVNASHRALAPVDRRLVFLRKAREGVFVGASGSMPPFSREVLTDADLGALLAFLGQYE